MIIRIQHLRLPTGTAARPGYCRDRSRAWLERHGFNWRDFVKNGVESDALLATNDPFAVKLVEAAEAHDGR